MRIIPGNAQNIGTRKEQQDDFGFSDIDNAKFISHGGVIAVLTDGMGGLEMGREASRTAVRAMRNAYEAKSPEESIPRALDRALHLANKAVFEMAQKAGLEEDVGTTLVAAVVHQDALHWISVGDSRIYLFRKGQLTRLTTDHVYARELDKEIVSGNISRQEAESNPDRDALTSYLGSPEIKEIDRNVNEFLLEPGDRILLCSDGLYRALSEQEMAQILGGHPQDDAESLVRNALSKKLPHQDNLTIAILACDPEDSISCLTLDKNTFCLSSGFAKKIIISGLILIGLILIGLAFITYKSKTTDVIKDTKKIPVQSAPVLDEKQQKQQEMPGELNKTLPQAKDENQDIPKQDIEPEKIKAPETSDSSALPEKEIVTKTGKPSGSADLEKRQGEDQ